MKETLYMHFRIQDKKNHNKLGKTGVNALARGGVTVVGSLSVDGNTIQWGAVKCIGDNYDKAVGRAEALKVATKSPVVTKNVDYNMARNYADALGRFTYESGVTNGLKLFKTLVKLDKTLV